MDKAVLSEKDSTPLHREIGASVLRICVALSCVFVGVWEDTFKAQKGWVVARWSSEGVNNGVNFFMKLHKKFIIHYDFKQAIFF